jgi:hypothetical protein
MNEFNRNLKLAIAVTLVAVWAITWLADTPVLGNLMLPLVVAPLVQYTSAQFHQPIMWRNRQSLLTLLAIAAALGAMFLLSRIVSEEQGKAFTHSAIFIVPIWALSTLGLVKQATALAQMAPNYSLKRTAADRL